MARRGFRLRRRALIGGSLGLLCPGRAFAFGEEGAFNPRIILTGDRKWDGVRSTAPARWADELTRRTSAPGRLRPTVTNADIKTLLDEPFGILAGAAELPALTTKELSFFKRYFSMGGLLLVDDALLAGARQEAQPARSTV